MKTLKVNIIADSRNGDTETLFVEQVKTIVSALLKRDDINLIGDKFLTNYARILNFGNDRQWSYTFRIQKKTSKTKFDKVVFETIEPLKRVYITYN